MTRRAPIAVLALAAGCCLLAGLGGYASGVASRPLPALDTLAAPVIQLPPEPDPGPVYGPPEPPTVGDLAAAIVATRQSHAWGYGRIAWSEAGEIATAVDAASRRYRLEPALLLGVALHETGYRSRAVSSAGCCGAWQHQPRHVRWTCEELADPWTAAQVAAEAIVRWRERHGDLWPCRYVGGLRDGRCTSGGERYLRRHKAAVEAVREVMR